MNSFSFVFLCSMVIFFATSIGSLLVYVLTIINRKTENKCLGLASGIMFASAIWSLLMPALDSTNFIFVLIGFVLGIWIIIKLDNFVKKYTDKKSKKNNMLFIAMTLHNIPEGMTVGLMSTYAYQHNSAITISAALALTIGIAIQNIPEGASISLNYRQAGLSKFKSAFLGILSGIVEPISAIIMFFLFKYLAFLLPFVLAAAAGIMIYVVINELMPGTTSENSNLGSIYFILGFIIMMGLDVLL